MCTGKRALINGLTHTWEHVYGQVLPANKESPFMYGMLAFALLEDGGRMREAEIAAKKALEIEPLDVWGQHAVRPCCNLHAHSANYDVVHVAHYHVFAKLFCQTLQLEYVANISMCSPIVLNYCPDFYSFRSVEQIVDALLSL